MITLNEYPFLVDFAENFPHFTISGDPREELGNLSISNIFLKEDLTTHTFVPNIGEKLTFYFETETIEYTIIAPTDTDGAYKLKRYNSATLMLTELQKKIAQNYYFKIFQTNFHIINVPETYILLTFNYNTENGRHFVQMATDSTTYTIKQNSANETPYYDPTYSAIIAHQSNLIHEDYYYPNYKIFGYFDIEKYVNGQLQTFKSPEFFLDINDKFKAKINTEILNSYFTEIDIPHIINETATPEPLQHTHLHYTLNYAEFYGNPAQVQELKTKNGILINGQIENNNAQLNTPDYEMGNNINVTFSNRPLMINYGNNSHIKNVKTFVGMPQYIYLLSSTQQTQSTITLFYGGTYKDGTPFGGQNNYTISQNENIYRIAISLEALNIPNPENVIAYDITIWTFNGGQMLTTRKTFNVIPKPYNAKIFLLQNKYGVLESFYINNETKNITTEGNQIIQNKKHETNINNTEISYTARTGYKTKQEMQLLAYAIQKPFNYKIENNTPSKITIAPNSFTIYDEKKDLQSAEFTYTYNIETSEHAYRPIPIIQPDLNIQWVDRIGNTNLQWQDNRAITNTVLRATQIIQ